MSKNKLFYAPADIDILRMENELLALEVRYLKARLAESARVPGSAKGSTSMSQLVHLEEAEQDLKLLLRRMGSSPLGMIFRFSGSFRTLEERYVRSSTERGMTPAARMAYLEGAEQDLKLLLRRMGSGPLGTIFRRRKSFQTLEQRYL